MNDPRRLIEEGTSTLGAHCLRAARAERAPHSSKLRTLSAVGLSGAGSALTGAAAGKAAAGSLSKWLLLGALGGGGALVAAVTFGTAEPMPKDRLARPQSSAASNAASRAPLSEPPTLEVAAPAPVENTRAPALTEPPRKRQPSSASLAAETEALDRARRDLERRDYSAALARLDRYQTSFRQGVLAPEASALRVQILHAMGRRAEADEKARLFLEQHPESPLGDRVRNARSAVAAPDASTRR